ncbi:MAG: CpsD/CapB family tyrosine-protein kinase [Chloroflexi bacterium]|nr:CpsD/CapB family tyrosine-protein kinase [Chloroflexota bacterium]
MSTIVDTEYAGTDFEPGESENGAGAWLSPNQGSARGGTLVESGSRWLFPDADEYFRSIYTRAGTGFVSEVLAVSSAIAGEGKTTVSVGLAVAMAQDFPERRVLLVETDLHRPVLADDFGVEATPGLVDCLASGEPLLATCRPTYLENLHVVPAGNAEGVIGRPLRSSQLAVVVDAMRQSYDTVILDLPSILVNSDSVLLTDVADGTICVVRAGVTPVALVTRALEQIEESKLRGVVLNGVDSAVPGWLRRLTGI